MPIPGIVQPDILPVLLGRKADAPGKGALQLEFA